MKHLSPEEFVELIDSAEDVRAGDSLPHLSTCAACRRQLASLRASLSSLSAGDGADVPEPSPLFWDHFSARVREAVAAEGSSHGRHRWELFGARGVWRWGAVRLAGALVLVAVAVALTTYVTAPAAPGAPASAPVGVVGLVGVVTDVASLEPTGAADDPVLSLIADLMADLDLDGASEALQPSPTHAGDADDFVSTLTSDERRELQRLLQEELAKPRA